MTAYAQNTGTPSRAAQYAERFVRANEDLIAAARSCSDENWRRPCPNDGRSVGEVAHHVAEVYPAFAHIVATLKSGEQFSPSASMDDVDRENAEHAQARVTVDRTATLDLLNAGSAEIASLLPALRDEQLDDVAGNFGGHELRVSQVIEFIVIGHTLEHLDSIRAALAA
jgi:uncharacterized damage-inducible protein DinB